MKNIGLIVGQGYLPYYFIKQAESKGYEVYPIGLFDTINEEIKQHKNFVKMSIGEIGKIISYLILNKASDLMMLGKVEKSLIFSGVELDNVFQGLMKNLPDQKDETILMGIMGILKINGIDILPQNYLMDELLTKEEVYTEKDSDETDAETIKIGIEAAKVITAIDAGQTVVVKEGTVVSIEAMEGTDKTIKRAHKYAGDDCIIVKMARPQQDFRMDIPVVGLETLNSAISINAKGLVIEAGKMLFVEQEEVLKLANEKGMFIKAIKR